MKRRGGRIVTERHRVRAVVCRGNWQQSAATRLPLLRAAGSELLARKLFGFQEIKTPGDLEIPPVDHCEE